MKLVVLCGGLAKRLGSLTDNCPKILIPINNYAFINYFIDKHIENGFREFIFVTGHLRKKIDREIINLKKRYKNVYFKSIYEGPDRLGTGGALKKIYRQLGNNFFLTYGDSFLILKKNEIIRMQHNYNHFGVNMLIYKNKDKYDISNVLPDKRGKILKYEKEKKDKFLYIDAGLLYFYNSKLIFSKLIKKKFNLSYIFSDLVKSGHLFSVKSRNKFFEIGSLDGIRLFERHINKN